MHGTSVFRLYSKVCVPYIRCHPEWGLLFQPNASDSGVVHGPHIKKHCSDINLEDTMHKRLEKEMATHSSVLAWRIPGTKEPGGLPSMGRTESDMTEAA